MVYLQYVCIINNGRIIALLREEGQFLSVPEHAGLMICCDGVPVFKSSGWCDDFMHCWFIPGQTLWPFLVITTSLPPKIRMDAENIMVTALWRGPCKPPMDILFRSTLSIVEEL